MYIKNNSKALNLNSVYKYKQKYNYLSSVSKDVHKAPKALQKYNLFGTKTKWSATLKSLYFSKHETV